MSSNVIKFTPRKKPPAYTIQAIMELDEEGFLITVRAIGDGKDRIPEGMPSNDVLAARALWQSAWCFWEDHARKDPDDDQAVIFMATVARGSRVNVFSPKEDHPDSFTTKERLEWLQRRTKEMVELAPPSWSAEPPASGTTSASHSANFDQLEFSW